MSTIDAKIQHRIEDMFKRGEIDNDFFNIDLHADIQNKLLEYQHYHVYSMITALKHHNVVIDGSETGTGKTYTTLAVCKQMKLKPYIICGKSMISVWKRVCEYFNINPIAVVNYETIRGCSEYNEDGDRIQSKYLVCKNDEYRWLIQKNQNIVIIFDEAHRCKNQDSQNGKILLATRNICKVILLSATLCDKPHDFIPFGYMFGFYKTMKQGKNWINEIHREDARKFGSKKRSSLYDHVFPEYGSLMNITDIGERFPKNRIDPECYNLDRKDRKVLNDYYTRLISLRNDPEAQTLGEFVKLHQKIESLKLPIFIEMIEKYLDQNKSVAVFVNYVATFNEICTVLNEKKILYGRIVGENQTEDERIRDIDNFQSNRIRLIICTVGAGSEGVSLHDINGRFPRISIISPSYSSIKMQQVLGRITRAGVKSPTIQKIIYCSDTYEDKICETVKNKMKFTQTLQKDTLTDNDLMNI